LKPVTKRASAVGQGVVVATVSVFEFASVHPSHFVCEIPRGQRPPQFLIEQHRGITAIDHCVAQSPQVIAARSGCKCVIEPLLIVSRGSDAVSAAWGQSEVVERGRGVAVFGLKPGRIERQV
jgi:hypothetical protein